MKGKHLEQLAGHELMDLHRLGKVAERRLESDDINNKIKICGDRGVTRVKIRGGADLHDGAIIMDNLGANAVGCDTDSRYSAALTYELTDDPDN